MAISFDTWLFVQKRRNDPIGDLARDASADVEMKCLKRPFTVDELHQHVLNTHGDDELIVDALIDAESEYKDI